MSQQQLLKRLVLTLESIGPPSPSYMLTGSIVSSAQGFPRTTHDIDVIVDLKPSHADRIAAAFPHPEFYCDTQSIRETISRGGMTNIIENQSGLKVDIWMPRETPFDHSRFDRRVRRNLDGVTAWVSSPEDTILQKLRWAQELGGSQKHFIDALRVYEVQRTLPGEAAEMKDSGKPDAIGLDEAYLDLWADRLGVADELARIRALAQ